MRYAQSVYETSDQPVFGTASSGSAASGSDGTKELVPLSAGSVASRMISQRSERQSFRKASASLLRKIMRPSVWVATTKSSPSGRIVT